jgi:ComF family protein
MRKAIHQLKYGGDMALGEILSVYLVRMFTKLKWEVRIVVPVPLALDRLSQRGYNQSSLLARPMAVQLGLEYLPNALNRVKETRAQVGLSARERKYNVFGAFAAKKALVSEKKVLVVDDVTTTGSTLDACASALLDAGASEVFAMTLARALGQSK